MVKEAFLMVRVDAAEKARIEAAAQAVGKSVTNLVLEETMKAVARIETAGSPKPPQRGHLPTYFRAACLTASSGGTQSYKWVGHSLVGSLANECPREMDLEDWGRRLKKLEKQLLSNTPDEEVIAWLESNLPHFIALVPLKRRGIFIEGMRERCREEGLPF